jgi:hypothetical protein
LKEKYGANIFFETKMPRKSFIPRKEVIMAVALTGNFVIYIEV